jgi:hypothetical protein
MEQRSPEIRISAHIEGKRKMNGLSTAVLILFGIWLGVLTLVIVLVVRQIALLTVRLSLMGNTFSLANDGPEVGGPLPDMVRSLLPEVGWERAHILWVQLCN